MGGFTDIADYLSHVKYYNESSFLGIGTAMLGVAAAGLVWLTRGWLFFINVVKSTWSAADRNIFEFFNFEYDSLGLSERWQVIFSALILANSPREFYDQKKRKCWKSWLHLRKAGRVWSGLEFIVWDLSTGKVWFIFSNLFFQILNFKTTQKGTYPSVPSIRSLLRVMKAIWPMMTLPRIMPTFYSSSTRATWPMRARLKWCIYLIWRIYCANFWRIYYSWKSAKIQTKRDSILFTVVILYLCILSTLFFYFVTNFGLIFMFSSSL